MNDKMLKKGAVRTNEIQKVNLVITNQALKKIAVTNNELQKVKVVRNDQIQKKGAVSNIKMLKAKVGSNDQMLNEETDSSDQMLNKEEVSNDQMLNTEEVSNIKTQKAKNVSNDQMLMLVAVSNNELQKSKAFAIYPMLMKVAASSNEMLKAKVVSNIQMPKKEAVSNIEMQKTKLVTKEQMNVAVSKDEMQKANVVNNIQMQKKEAVSNIEMQKAKLVSKDQMKVAVSKNELQKAKVVSNTQTLKKEAGRNIEMQEAKLVSKDQMMVAVSNNEMQKVGSNDEMQKKEAVSNIEKQKLKAVSNIEKQKAKAVGNIVKQKAKAVSNDQMLMKGTVSETPMQKALTVNSDQADGKGKETPKSQMSSVSAVCPHCGKTFSNRSNCTRHVRTAHTKDEKRIAVKNKQHNVTCSFCEKQYAYRWDLKRHVFATHLFSLNEGKVFKCSECPYISHYGSANLKKHMKKHIRAAARKQKGESSQGGNGAVKCSSCNRTFLTVRSLKYHERCACHLMKDRLQRFKKICAICSVHLYEHRIEGVFMHYEKDHGIELKWENHTFNSLAELMDWKNIIEKETTSFYAIVGGSLKDRNFSFRCHRSGMFKRKRNLMGKRKLKTNGSCKINAFCPSMLKVRKKESVYVVNYLSTHIGHDNDLKHIPLRPEERILIANKLKQNLTSDEILKSIQESADSCLTPKMSLLKKKDIYNVKQSLGKKAEKQYSKTNNSVDVLDVMMNDEVEKDRGGTEEVYQSSQKEIEISVVPHLDYEDYSTVNSSIIVNPEFNTKDISKENVILYSEELDMQMCDDNSGSDDLNLRSTNLDTRVSILKEKFKEIELFINNNVTSHSQVDYLESSFGQILSTINKIN